MTPSLPLLPAAPMTWRMLAKCETCPFATSGKGLALRRTLARGRWKEILDGLRHEQHFFCHKTTKHVDDEDDFLPDASTLVCAGSLEWSEAHGVSQNYVRVCETLDYFRRKDNRRPLETR